MIQLQPGIAGNTGILEDIIPHLLYHTAFGFRLRAAGVSFKDRQDLLGHLIWLENGIKEE